MSNQDQGFWNKEEQVFYKNKLIEEFVFTVLDNWKRQDHYINTIEHNGIGQCDQKTIKAVLMKITNMYPMYRIYVDDNSASTQRFKQEYSRYILLGFVELDTEFMKYLFSIPLEAQIVITEYITLLRNDNKIPTNLHCTNCKGCRGCVYCIECINCTFCSNCNNCNNCRFSAQCTQCYDSDSATGCIKSEQCNRSRYITNSFATMDSTYCDRCYSCKNVHYCKCTCYAYDTFCQEKVHGVRLYDQSRQFVNKVVKCVHCKKRMCHGYHMLCCDTYLCVTCYNREYDSKELLQCPVCKYSHVFKYRKNPVHMGIHIVKNVLASDSRG